MAFITQTNPLLYTSTSSISMDEYSTSSTPTHTNPLLYMSTSSISMDEYYTSTTSSDPGTIGSLYTDTLTYKTIDNLKSRYLDSNRLYHYFSDTDTYKIYDSLQYTNIAWDSIGPVLENRTIPWDVDDNPINTKRNQIRSRMAVHIKSRAQPIQNVPENERVAIETLREFITEAELRKYLKYGFVLVPAASGKTYQVFRNKYHTKVWKGGKLVEEVCVRISDSKIPPTDNVIAFLNMIQADENEFRKLGNVYNMRKAA